MKLFRQLLGGGVQTLHSSTLSHINRVLQRLQVVVLQIPSQLLDLQLGNTILLLFFLQLHSERAVLVLSFTDLLLHQLCLLFGFGVLLIKLSLQLLFALLETFDLVVDFLLSGALGSFCLYLLLLVSLLSFDGLEILLVLVLN